MKKLFVLMLLLTLCLSACGGSEANVEETSMIETVPAEFAGQINPYGAEVSTAGGELFQIYCASCHGESGLGDGIAGASLEPAPSNLVELQTSVGDDYLFWRIRAGKDGTAMVAWKGILTDEQIWQVVAFIRTLK